MRAYIEAQRVRDLTGMTVEKREWTLWRFVERCHERGPMRPEEVTRPILERYQRIPSHEPPQRPEPDGSET